MAKGLTILADMRREEHQKSLMEMPERDLCEMIRSHFESHPTLPGEKELKDLASQRLVQLESAEEVLKKDGFVPAADVPFGTDEDLSVKTKLAADYAQTRIRETSLKEGNYYLDFRHFDPSELKRNPVDELPRKNGAPVHVDRVDVELQNNGVDVYVMACQSDGGLRMIGTLPDNFLTNNPMNVDKCEAELQIVDFSNGNLKNISAKVVVDTDLMSGDVLDLDDDLLQGLSQDNELTQ